MRIGHTGSGTQGGLGNTMGTHCIWGSVHTANYAVYTMWAHGHGHRGGLGNTLGTPNSGDVGLVWLGYSGDGGLVSFVYSGDVGHTGTGTEGV